MQISAIVPVVDEAARLPALLGNLARIPEIGEVLVVDGGSRDDSVAVACAHGARVLRSRRRQRAAQLNLGGRHARGDVLLFLHADTLLPASAGRSIRRVLAREPRAHGGHFRRRFVGGPASLAFTSRVADLRARYWGVSFGDQAQFVRARVFRGLRGFRDCRCAEDMDLARRLWKRGHTVTLGPPVLSSARRFACRPWRVVLADGWRTLVFAFAPPCSEHRPCG